MLVSLETRAGLERSDDPTLESILAECELEAEVDITCELDGRGAYLEHLEVKNISFHPPDSTEAIKAMFLMNPDLANTIKDELVKKVKGDWDRYEELAYEYAESERLYAIECAYEEQKESGYYE